MMINAQRFSGLWTRPLFTMPMLAALCLLVPSSSAPAESMRQTLEFSTADVSYAASNGYDQVYLAGCDITRQVGHPQVVVKTVHVALPAGAEITGLEILSTQSQDLPGLYRLFPCQPPFILSRGDQDISFVAPNAAIYASASEYPGVIAEPAPAGSFGGYQVAGVTVYPLQYNPREQRLRLLTRIEVAIEYEVDRGKRPLPSRRSAEADRRVRKLVRTFVASEGPLSKRVVRDSRGSSSLPAGNFEYVIIAPPAFVSTLTPLADWKTEKGVPATIVTTDWIYSNYTGVDEAEQVRNFVIDAYQNWGTVWILLGGDTPLVPHRFAYAMDVEWGTSGENDLPADLYFVDLDGNWDANGNGVYGEVDDNVDLYAELFVGRASCENITEIEAWVTKLLNYERNPPTDYQLDMLFFAEEMWHDPYTDGGVAKDLIDNLYVPPRFDPITKLYQSLGNESEAAVIAQLNTGQNIANHNGHCWINIISTGSGSLRNYDMDALTNGARQTSFLYSIGCWPAAFDYNCIAEHFIANPNGGGIAFVGNGSYGWGSPGNPTFGYSDRYDQQFFAAVLQDSINQLGAALAKAKAVYASHSRDENVYRWHQYQVNLLGDPETPIWTDTPRQLYVHHPDTIPTGDGEYTITVLTADMSAPVANAMICLLKNNDVYERAVTGPDGMALLSVMPASDGGMLITVTAYNAIPYQASIVVGTGGKYVEYDSHAIDDSAGGNGDGTANPGESVVLWLTVENHGPGMAGDLTGSLYSRGDASVSLLDSALDFGDVPAGTKATSLTGCAVDVDAGCPDGHVALFDWMLTDNGGQSFSGTISVQVDGCVLSYYHYFADDAVGNGNGRPDPGETCDLRVWVKNEGLAQAEDVVATLSSGDAMITILDPPVSLGDIVGGGLGAADFGLTVDPLCGSPHFAELQLSLDMGGGSRAVEDFIFAIGPNGYCTDMETGLSDWSHGGTPDVWTTTNHRRHSGSTSWYCGHTGLWQYEHNMNCWLGLPQVMLGPDSRLIFWDWFSVPNFGVDGVHVIVTNLNTSDVDTLDFIGTGGALDSLLLTGNDWTKECYNLSAYPAGTPVSVRIAFTSDGEDVAEGFYIDDFCIESAPDYDVSMEPVRNQLSGLVGDTVVQRLRVENWGFWEDQFDLSVSCKWNASLWNADGTAMISRTAPIAPGASELVLLKTLVCGAAAGAKDTLAVTGISCGDADRCADATITVTSEGGCDCPYQGNLDASADIDAVDLGAVIDILFFGDPDIQDPHCYRTRADCNADGQADALDLTDLINYLYYGGEAPADPCGM